ncbi:MAG: aspartate/glutamate racemase [Thermoleophilia bacterium]|nr:aspartate/glutamate racemase [Thermoleophilia bacterium]
MASATLTWRATVSRRLVAADVRTIGLLGGMSWESTLEYERVLTAEVRRRLGRGHSADMLIRCYDFADIEALQSRGRWQEAGELLARDAERLLTAGAEVLLLCTNTMHSVAAGIEAVAGDRFVHIADATADAILAAGVRRVALLGTRFTMEQAFYRSRLEGRGIDVLIPDEPDRERLHAIIYDELVRGEVRDGSRADVLAIIGRLTARGTAGVIAGCTEIELLVTAADVTVPYFPTARLHAVAGVDAALASQRS